MGPAVQFIDSLQRPMARKHGPVEGENVTVE
jgi:hypothetical protein